jgi:hypothetical protein
MAARLLSRLHDALVQGVDALAQVGQSAGVLVRGLVHVSLP